MQIKRGLPILTALGVLMGIGSAHAASPVGQWRVTFFLEPGLTTGATQGICFKADKTWYSSTFPNWRGNWFQKGDRFHWVGTTGIFDTPNFGQFISNTTMGGEFGQAVSATGAAALNGNWSAAKAGAICAAPAAAAGGRGGNPVAD